MGRLAVIPPYAANVSAQALKEHPRWARSVIAYKILMMMIPWPLSKRLWAILIRAGILPPPAAPGGPEPVVTTNPDGTTTVTTTTPDGTTTNTTIAPDGTITSTTTAPDGTTTTETTTPDGTTTTTTKAPDGTTTTTVTTPDEIGDTDTGDDIIYVPPWEPGPVHRPTTTATAACGLVWVIGDDIPGDHQYYAMVYIGDGIYLVDGNGSAGAEF